MVVMIPLEDTCLNHKERHCTKIATSHLADDIIQSVGNKHFSYRVNSHAKRLTNGSQCRRPPIPRVATASRVPAATVTASSRHGVYNTSACDLTKLMRFLSMWPLCPFTLRILWFQLSAIYRSPFEDTATPYGAVNVAALAAIPSPLYPFLSVPTNVETTPAVSTLRNQHF